MSKQFKKYKNLGGAYHWDRITYNPLKRKLFSQNIYFTVLKLIPKLKDKKLLDIGCGDGILPYLIAKKKGGLIFGIDNNSYAIKLAKNKVFEDKYLVNFRLANCNKIPFPINYFDYIISTDVVEHLERPEVMLAEAYRKLKPNGIMIHSTPIKRKDMPTSEYHYREYTPNEFKNILERKLREVCIIKINPKYIYVIDQSKLKIFLNVFSLISKVNPYNIFRSVFNNFTYMIGIGKK